MGALVIRAGCRTRFGDFSLDVDLTLPGQGVTALFGRSGSGKTTLLRCIAGLQENDGAIHVNGAIWQEGRRRLPVHKRPLAYVFQEASLFPHLSVRGNLEYGFKRVPPARRRVAFDDAVAWLGVERLLERRPDGLSGGERQRVAIARALLTSPELLLMDEPLSALDHPSRGEIMPYLERLHDTLSIPVLYVTHSPDEVARLADHVVLMEGGRAIAAGPLTETLARIDLPMIRQDEDAGVVIEATAVEHDADWHLVRAEFPGGCLWTRDPGSRIGQKLRLRIMARDLSLALEHHGDTSILNVLPAVVTQLADGNHPAVRLVRVEIGETPFLARLTSRSVAALDLKPGKEVWVQIKSVAIVD
ncbi:MAG: molybdenum ABC transporter ATP-binding protein [Gammaproteobacteria bacterium]|nr:molybdenum ABC transporter ATP-binding protein [Gammaproteobacteria bacterium]